MEELCCISLLGELCPEEQAELDAHLRECGSCRKLREEIERIACFDLSAAAVARLDEPHPSGTALHQPQRMLSRVLEQAQRNQTNRASHAASSAHTDRSDHPQLAASIFDMRHGLRTFLTGAACFAAGACLVIAALGLRDLRRAHAALHMKPAAPAPAWTTPIAPAPSHTAIPDTELSLWKERVLSANDKVAALQVEVDRFQKLQATSSKDEADLKDAYSKALNAQALLQQQLTDSALQASTLTSELQNTRVSLAQMQRENLSLKVQLEDDKAFRRGTPNTEAAEQARGAAPVQSSNTVSEADARELFGARDLHIVDVYDVDHAGKTQRAYGRVYYVDRRLLLFYAFDLSKLRKGRELTSFQAWGYRDPNSSQAKSLGLFRIDDAALNRWVLRVSNADILARIDTVFVTLEPPHGSPYPSGQKLLLASLAGPANHP